MPRVRNVRTKAKEVKPWKTFTCGQVDYKVFLLPRDRFDAVLTELGEDPSRIAAASYPMNGVVLVQDTESVGMNEVLLMHEMMHCAVANIGNTVGPYLGLTAEQADNVEEAFVELGAPRLLEALRTLK